MLRGRSLQCSIPIINCAEQCSTSNSSVWNSGFDGFHCCERSEKWALSHGIERETALSFVFFLFLWGRRKQKSDSVKLSNIASLTPDCQLIGDETFAPKALR